MKKILPVFLALFLAISNATSIFACTGFYVGSETTENGSTYMGRSEDIGDLYGKVFGIAPSRTIEEGEVYEDTYGFVMDYTAIDFDYPTTTYRYSFVRDSYQYGETFQDADGNYIGEAYAAAGQNEKGVAMTATVSTRNNNKAKAADKLLGTGLCEVSLPSVILAGAATAREAVELLAAIIDVYGAGECNAITFSDPNETWYFEVVSGHQYAAVKMPKDKVSFNPNIMLLGVIDVNDTENVVASENLVKLAEDNGFLVTDENGKIDVVNSYGAGSGSYKRYWQGLFYFNEEAANAIDPTSTFKYEYLVDSTKKLSTLDVLRFLAFRGEGSVWDYSTQPNLGNSNVIGTRSQSECHVFETRHGMPKELAVLQWQAMADAEFSVYVPYFTALITETDELYHTETRPNKIDTLTGDTEGKINTNFHLINYLCDMNRATDPTVAAAVKEYMIAYQESLIEQQKEVDEVMTRVYAHGLEAAQVAATGVGKDLAKQVSEMSSAVLAEIRAYFAGDKTEEFALSEETLALMPNYTIAEEYLPEHTWEVEFDEENHWNECPICGETQEAVAHTFVEKTDETNHWEECECGAIANKEAHTWEEKFDKENHWSECECGEKQSVLAHTWVVKSDEENHWEECECGAIANKEAHTFEEGVCTECEAKDPTYVAPTPEEKPEEKPEKGDTPSTGDDSNVMLYVALMGLAAIAGVVLLKNKKSELN